MFGDHTPQQKRLNIINDSRTGLGRIQPRVHAQLDLRYVRSSMYAQQVKIDIKRARRVDFFSPGVSCCTSTLIIYESKYYGIHPSR